MALLCDDDDELLFFYIRYLGDNLITCNPRVVKHIGNEAFMGNYIKTLDFRGGYACIYVWIVLIVKLSSTICKIRPIFYVLRLSYIGELAFAYNQLTSVRFIG